MVRNEYNGWTNYATWRVNLEIFDNYQWDDEEIKNLTVDYLEEMIENYVFDHHGDMGLMESYARAFLSEVNYYEIKQEILEDYENEKKYNR